MRISWAMDGWVNGGVTIFGANLAGTQTLRSDNA